MVSATVVGASGYMGSELLRILVNHPDVSRIVAVSRKLAGKPVSDLHRNLYGRLDSEFVDLDLESIDTDVAFFAAPPGEWFTKVPSLLEKGIKVITLGGKFRINDPAIDMETYGGFEDPDLINERVYGLPEIYRDLIRKARFVTNPGCYPTSVILGITPLKEFTGSIDTARIVVNSVSGSSGAGAKPSQRMHHPEFRGNVKAYNIISHRHTPEMECILNDAFNVQGGHGITISFIPMVADIKRGITSCITIHCPEGFTGDVNAHYDDYYGAEPFVRVTSEVPELVDVVGSNYCDIHASYDPKRKRIAVISSIDNLVKGGSGQAVQNMNLMFGLDEKTGLGMLAGHP